MKIAYLNVCGQMGGAETSLLQMLVGIRKSQPNWKLHLILGQGGPLTFKAQAVGVQTSVIPFPAALAQLGDRALTLTQLSTIVGALAQSRQYIRTLGTVLRDLKPEIIHATGFKMHLLSVWARPSRIPVIWHIHDYVSNRPMMSRLMRAHSHRCNTIIVNSRGVRDDVRRICSRDLKVVPLYNSIDLKKFSPSGPAADLDAAAGIPPAQNTAFRVGLLATFAKWKGHKLFLKALSLLPPELPVRGYIVGGAIYQTRESQCSIEELQTEASRLGIGDRVGFTGFVDDTASVMRSLDVIVHASTQPEPFGMVIAEGLACGKPVIAAADSGAAEIFQDGKDILTYPRGDAGALANCLIRSLIEADLRERLGETGRRSAEALLDSPRLAAELDTIYQRMRSQVA